MEKPHPELVEKVAELGDKVQQPHLPGVHQIGLVNLLQPRRAPQRGQGGSRCGEVEQMFEKLGLLKGRERLAPGRALMKGQSGNWITRPFFFKRFKQQNGVGNLLVRKQDPVDGEVAWSLNCIPRNRMVKGENQLRKLSSNQEVMCVLWQSTCVHACTHIKSVNVLEGKKRKKVISQGDNAGIWEREAKGSTTQCCFGHL